MGVAWRGARWGMDMVRSRGHAHLQEENVGDVELPQVVLGAELGALPEDLLDHRGGGMRGVRCGSCGVA